MSNEYTTWGYNPDRSRIIYGNDRKILLHKMPSYDPKIKTISMEDAGIFPTVVAKRYDNNPVLYSASTTFPFDVCVTGRKNLSLDHGSRRPITIPAADGSLVYFLDYGFGLADEAAHEGDIYFKADAQQTSTVSQYVYDLELQIFGITVPRRTYAYNIDCGNVTACPDYNPAHPEVYSGYVYYRQRGYSLMVHWPGLHIRREADWSTYINGTYVGKWNPQWRDQHITTYLDNGGKTEDLIPPRIKNIS